MMHRASACSQTEALGNSVVQHFLFPNSPASQVLSQFQMRKGLLREGKEMKSTNI